MKFIDDFLNKITMYKLVMYCLISWLLIAGALSALGMLPFSPVALAYSTAVLLVVSYITNKLFTLVFETHANEESAYITALILACIITPPAAAEFMTILPFLVWAGVWAMASKFILAVNKKHVFNPAAFAVALTAITLNQSATWWVGTLYMLPFIAIGGLLITRKIRRFDLVISFAIVAIVTVFLTSPVTSALTTLQKIFVESPLGFFATVMLTEPLTTPPTRLRRVVYGALVGVLFAPNIHVGSFYTTPEIALLIGNIFAWLMSPKFKLTLKLIGKNRLAADTGEFVFAADRAVSFRPGQYLEWTLAHRKVDLRGNRRYFTIASSPSEKELRLGVKFDSRRSSSFKKALAELPEGATIMAGQLSGDFTMPKNPAKKMVWIAGGIGVTPFRAMAQYMLDHNERRDVVLMYSVKMMDELAYGDVFEELYERFGVRTVATLTDLNNVPADWRGHRGFIDAAMIAAEVPDYRDRIFYISGPHALVDASKKVLRGLGVPRRHIRTDYFPGL